MDKRFLTAFICPDRFYVGGYRLDPFCIKHLLQLQAARSPFVVPREDYIPTPEDAIVFLRVCEHGSVGITSLKQRFIDWVIVGLYHLSPTLYTRVLHDIVGYVTECSTAPKVVNKEGGHTKKVDNVKSMDELLTLVAFLVRKTSMTEQEVMTMPLGKAMWYSVAVATIEGAKLKVVTTEEEENVEADRQRLAEIQKMAEEEVRLAMVNGKIPKRKINPNKTS